MANGESGGDGPFIQTAVICERVLTEQDGAVSAIRIIDRVYFAADPTGRPLNAIHPIWFLIALKSGGARGRYSVQVVREKPSGEREPILEVPVLFEGEERGPNVVVQAGFQPDQEGLYWFDVMFQGERITRMPLRAVFQPLPQAQPHIQ
ncbi:MAG: hypothetical protein ACLP01_15625 [Solirubrobacteraceae bacterium]